MFEFQFSERRSLNNGLTSKRFYYCIVNLGFSCLFKAVAVWRKLVLNLAVTMNHHDSDSSDSGSSEGSPESSDFTDMVS